MIVVNAPGNKDEKSRIFNPFSIVISPSPFQNNCTSIPQNCIKTEI
ncbi:hypothetical protein D1B33_16505 [Lysinibacillus yapensis]|uniref:Uncharacterized protein n=1 Tax=Ureibacillus yapensis TaxID=2304605 RepID=A0A396SBA2_9BACL|nr:hypothetical protein D1B33_16505 [Lysinibacillus yapensis]